MTDKADEIAELRAEFAAELAKVKASQPTKIDAADMARFRDEMHRISEARMSRASNFHPDDLRAMEAACPTAAVKDIAAHGHIPSSSISAVPTSQQVTSIHSNAGMLGSNTGWAPEQRFGPQPGIQHVDALVDAQDRKDLDQRILQELAVKP